MGLIVAVITTVGGGVFGMITAFISADDSGNQPPPAITTSPAPAGAAWHFYKSYWTKPECDAAGRHDGQKYKCTYGMGTDGRYKYSLYVRY
ncbi:hypothetical protein ACFRU3_33795 [Streptomyces sp. NPDC056910]|uniref:hypothetical protein n=1 Tax=Streptomyces sp. NPDC056910 TaxID=3345964 RepID=UPI0036C71C29